MHHIRYFPLRRQLSLSQPFIRLIAVVILGLAGLGLAWLSLPGQAKAGSANPGQANVRPASAIPRWLPPVVTDDLYVLTEDTLLVVPGSGVLANDFDPDGNPLTASLAVTPTHGVITLTSTGSFTYTPAMNFAGQDTFSYLASDGGSSITGVVTLTVQPANDPPAVGLATVLYKGALGTPPGSQSFTFLPNGSFTQTTSGGLTTLTTTNDSMAGYFHISPPFSSVLNRDTGYTLRFAAQVVSESRNSNADKDGDGVDDRAGFSVLVLSHDTRGIELGFWTDRIWAQDDGQAEPPPATITRTLFTQAEGVTFNTTSLITYELTISGMAYSLAANGSEVLSGSLRDYSAFAGLLSPYQTPNLIFLGDDTSSAQAVIRLGYVSLITNTTLPNQTVDQATDLPVPGLGVLDLDSEGEQEVLTLTANDGVLTVSTTMPGGVPAGNLSGNGTATLVMTGTLAQLNQTLGYSPTFLTYRSLPNFAGIDTVTLTLNDRGFTGGGARADSKSFQVLVNGPALNLSKTVNNPAPTSGERITYTLVIFNGGNQDATNGLVSDPLPAGLTLAGPVSLSPDGAGTAGTPPTLASNLTLTAGQQVTVTLPVTVDTGLVDGQVITNTATVSSAEVAPPASSSIALTVDNRGEVQFSSSTFAAKESEFPTVITVTLNEAAAFPVSVTVASSDGTASHLSDYQPLNQLLSFTSGQTVLSFTLTLTNDAYAENNETLGLSLSNPLNAGLGTPATATLVVADDDEAGVLFSTTAGLTTTEAGGTASFDLRLRSRPTAPVTLTLSSSDAGEGVAQPALWVFDNTNWTITRTVTITGQDDSLVDGPISYTIVLAPLTSSDPFYQGLDPADVSVTNLDDDLSGSNQSNYLPVLMKP